MITAMYPCYTHRFSRAILGSGSKRPQRVRREINFILSQKTPAVSLSANLLRHQLMTFDQVFGGGEVERFGGGGDGFLVCHRQAKQDGFGLWKRALDVGFGDGG